MENKSGAMSKKALLVFRYRLFLIAFLLSLLITILFPLFSAWWWTFTGIWVGVFLFYFFFYYPLKFKKLHFFLTEDYMKVNTGIIYTRHRYIYKQNIQYILFQQTPLQRHFELYTVIVYAAGGTLILPGFSKADAQCIRSYHYDDLDFGEGL